MERQIIFLPKVISQQMYYNFLIFIINIFTLDVKEKQKNSQNLVHKIINATISKLVILRRRKL